MEKLEAVSLIIPDSRCTALMTGHGFMPNAGGARWYHAPLAFGIKPIESSGIDINHGDDITVVDVNTAALNM